MRFNLAGARPGPAVPDVETCQALLASHDPPGEVLFHLQRYLSSESAFLTRLDVDLVKHWRGERRLPFLGHAWLYRWDTHLAALSDYLDPGRADPVPFPARDVASALHNGTGSQPAA